jgi:hypothetical protein
MGAHRVALVLRDGQIIEDVQVAWGDDVIRIGGRDQFELPIDDIVDVLNRA